MAQVPDLPTVADHVVLATPEPEPSPIDARPRRGEILLIEDRDDVRGGLAQLLEFHGFMVIEVPDAERGMRELAAHADGIALIVLDLLLPGPSSGFDFRESQLADPELAVIPTIVITASDVDEVDRPRLHADGWLDKPFRFESLLELVRRFVIEEADRRLA